VGEQGQSSYALGVVHDVIFGLKVKDNHLFYSVEKLLGFS